MRNLLGLSLLALLVCATVRGAAQEQFPSWCSPEATDAPEFPMQAWSGHWSAKVVVRIMLDEQCKLRSIKFESIDLSGGPGGAAATKIDKDAIRDAFARSMKEAVMTWNFYGHTNTGYLLVPIGFDWSDHPPKPAQKRLVLPFDDKLRGYGGMGSGNGPLFVDDAAVESNVPWLKDAGKRLSTCFSSMTTPQQLFVAYRPAATGEHVGQANVLHCEHTLGSEKLLCDNVRKDEKVVFDETPDKYFSVGAVDLAEALPFIRALLNHELRYAGGVPNQRPEDINGFIGSISREKHRWRLSWGSCFGGGGSISVDRKQDKAGKWFYEVLSQTENDIVS